MVSSTLPRHALSDYTDVATHSTPIGTFVSLYAGAGGLDVGFALAGFAPVWVNDVDVCALETHERIFKRLTDELPHLAGRTWITNARDLLDAKSRGELPEPFSADLVIGGPPCQGFSIAGKMDPEDERSRHLNHFMDVVEHVRPRAFVMENVRALLENKRWEATRQRLQAKAELLGFRTQMFLCNAAHFGVPQARLRMILVGIRDAQPIAPVATTAECPPTVREAFRQLPRFGAPGNDGFCTAKISPAKSPILRRSPFAGMLFNGSGRPLDLDAPSLTVPASMGGNRTPVVDQAWIDDPNLKSWVVEYHNRLSNGGEVLKQVPSSLRRITVQEAAAIQTFPTNAEWAGPPTSQFRQIGNAVPPRLALAVADSVASTAFG